jgi:hypothetical protein
MDHTIDARRSDSAPPAIKMKLPGQAPARILARGLGFAQVEREQAME